MMLSIQEQLRRKLIVSCQAWPGDPLEDTDAIRRMALAALQGGAAGLRINSAEHIAAIRRDSDVPIIGIQKRFMNGVYRITPDFEAAQALAAAGASIIALDCTDRSWPAGDPWQELVGRIHAELYLPIMADVATLDEAIAAVGAGADFVGPTLNGYTDYTRGIHSFNWPLLAEMARSVSVPIIAEGHISTPSQARRAVDNGAWCVVVGSAITRPGEITAGFVRAMQPWAERAPAIGVDLGGTSIKAGLVSGDGQITMTEKVATRADQGRDAVKASLLEVIGKVVAQASAQGIEPCGLGIASAGAIHTEDGTVFAATSNLPNWAGFNLRQVAEERFHLPTYVINDAHAAVLAELHYGLGRSFTDFVAITIGTGVGGGIVCNGKLLLGQHGLAGTVGHQTIRIDGRSCNCGRKGCLEAYVSTAALLQEYEDLGGVMDASVRDNAGRAFQISRLAIAGDPTARKAYAILGGYLAEGIANIFNLFDPQALVISGGLVEGQREFIREVEKCVTGILHFGEKRKPQIELAASGHHTGVQGAGALVFERLS
jgi:putative N-acetylmannosamine-6-phosphate epimerase/predicted NBD/HSP70 family sugar kinase